MAFEELFNLIQSSSGGGISVGGTGNVRRGQSAFNPRVGDVYDPKSSVGKKQQKRFEEKQEKRAEDAYARAATKAERERREKAGERDLTREEANQMRKDKKAEYRNMEEGKQQEVKDILDIPQTAAEERRDNRNINTAKDKLANKKLSDFIKEQEALEAEENFNENVADAMVENLKEGNSIIDEAVNEAADRGAEKKGGGPDAEKPPPPKEPFSPEQIAALNDMLSDLLKGFKCDCSHCSCEGR